MKKEQLINILENEIIPTNRKGLEVNFPTDLRQSINMKIEQASETSKWTAFVNNAGTLVHIIAPANGFLFRLQFKYPIKHLSKAAMQKFLINHTRNYIIL